MSRTALILTALSAVLVTAGWYLLLVRPVQEQIDQTEILVAEEADTEWRLRSQLVALQRIEDNMLTYFAALGEIERSIPTSPQTASLIDDLSVLANDTGVVWESGSYGNPVLVEGTGYFEIPVTIAISGQFFEVLGYLYGIADMERLIRIESIGISPSQDDAGFTILSVAISARAFTSGDVSGVPVEDAAEAAESESEGDEPAEDSEAEAAAPVRAN